MLLVVQIVVLMLFTSCADAEFYEDRRCRCVCPGLDISANKSRGVRTFYQDNHASPEECNCNDMVLPLIAKTFNGSFLTYCIQCDCRFEMRNTTIVMVVVITLLAIISVLMLYMVCILLLKKCIKHRKTIKNQRLGNEEQLLSLLEESRPDNSEEEN